MPPGASGWHVANGWRFRRPAGATGGRVRHQIIYAMCRRPTRALASEAKSAGTVLGPWPRGAWSRARQGWGRGATRLAARGLGKSAQAALPRLAGAVTREGVMGAGLSDWGRGSAKRTREDLTLSEAAHHLALATGKGAAIGAGLGALGWGVGTAARKVKAKYNIGVGATKSLRQEQALVRAEAEAVQAAGATEAQLARVSNRLDDISSRLVQAQTKTAGGILSKVMAYGVGHAMGGGPVGGLIGSIIPKRLVDGVKKMLGGKASRLAADPRQLSLGIGGAQATSVPLSTVVESVTKKLAPTASTAAVASMNAAELDQAAGELGHVDVPSLGVGLLASLPESMPMPIKESVVNRVTAAMGFLQGEAPSRPDEGRIASGATSTPPASELRRYQRSFKAIVQPDSVVESFLAGPPPPGPGQGLAGGLPRGAGAAPVHCPRRGGCPGRWRWQVRPRQGCPDLHPAG